jgi:hypothetical protein
MEFGVFIESPFKVVEGDDESGPTVEDAPFQDIHVEKSPKTMGHGRPERTGAPAVEGQFVGTKR